MDSATITPEEAKAIEGLQERMAGKTPAEQTALMRSFAQEHYAAKSAPVVTLTDDQLSRVFDFSDAKEVAKEVTTDIERGFGIPYGEAKEIADQEVSHKHRRRKNYYEDCAMAAKGFRAIAMARRGNGSEYDRAREEEAAYIKRTGFDREVRTMTVGTGANGGYLAPEIWNTFVYEALARVSLLRKQATWIPMESDIMRLPKITANVTASTTAENAASGFSQPTIAQLTWTLKKLTVLTNPFSVELLENARPELIPLLTQIATIELHRKEDEVLFNTSDSAWSSQFLLTAAGNNIQMATGGVDITHTTFDNMADLINALPEQYIPDDDVQGSGIVNGGEAAFYANKALINVLSKLKATTGQYLWHEVTELNANHTIYGYKIHRALSLPAAPSVSTKFALFGNLAYDWVGFKPGFIVNLLDQGTVNSVNLNENSMYALRIIEMLDHNLVDTNAVATLETSAS